MSSYKLRTKDIEKLIKDVESNEQINKFDLDIYTFLNNFNIVQIALGTVIGFASTKIIENISISLIMPFIHSILIYFNFLNVNLFGVNLNIQNIMFNLIYFLLILGLVYLIVKYLLYDYIKESITNNKLSNLKNQKLQLFNLLINKKILNTLDIIRENSELSSTYKSFDKVDEDNYEVQPYS